MTAFDPALVQRGARLKRSPYFECTQRAGCRGYTVYNHMLLPICYDDPVNEYRKLLEGVTLWDVSVERNVEISGPDGARFAELLTPRDLSKCKVGEGRYVLLVDDAGGIVNDPVLLRLAEDRFWLACADSDVLLWAKGLALRSGLRVDVRELDVAPLQLQGPKSRQVAHALFGECIAGLGYYGFFETRLDGIPLIVTRTGWTGELGYELYLLDPSRGEDLWNRVLAAGKPFGLAPTGPSDIRRIEAGILNYGIDMTIENDPYEVGMGRLVDLDKPQEFVGRDALRRIKEKGPARRLVGLEIGGAPLDLNMTRWPVRADGRALGHVTSAVHSPRLDRNIGYAFVPAQHAAEGTRFEVATSAGARAATVVPMPFFDPARVAARS
ncbi:MAG TPA: glycine cleavage T C-terminal barrel domain-containing protein [Burkholderiales bacterium]|jgi:aminomethyltransferase|nr:glycine cleavage T C-terminal barrel domain-containing protein [Burkholderiales bacterium]